MPIGVILYLPLSSTCSEIAKPDSTPCLDGKSCLHFTTETMHSNVISHYSETGSCLTGNCLSYCDGSNPHKECDSEACCNMTRCHYYDAGESCATATECKGRIVLYRLESVLSTSRSAYNTNVPAVPANVLEANASFHSVWIRASSNVTAATVVI